jgi:molybdopterin converting factor small subunit
MQVTIRLFTQMRIDAGAETIPLHLPAGATVTSALTALTEQHPGLGKHLRSCMIAVDLDYVPKDHPLREHDEISLIPPVQGG